MRYIKNVFVLLVILLGWSCLLAQTYHLGDIYEAPDGSQGVVYYLNSDGSGGLVVALHDASAGCSWGELVDIPTLQSYIMSNSYNTPFHVLMADTSGYTNTTIIRAFQNNNPSFAAGVVDVANGWVLPSPEQMAKLFGQLPFISSALVNAGGEEPSYNRYWCSAECDSARAWVVNFDNSYSAGNFLAMNKANIYPVRAVRSFSYESPQLELSYSWSTGDNTTDITVTPTQTTTYTVTVSTPGGCADTVEHTIVVKSATEQTFYDEVCQGEVYEGNGFILTAAETSMPGLLIRTRTDNAGGCLSTYTLELTVVPSPHTDIEMIACDEYQWNGQTYTTSGDYMVSYPYPDGCDSVVTLHLTMSYTPDANVTANRDSICYGEEISIQTEIENMSVFLVTPSPSIVTVGDILCTDNSTVKASDWPVTGKTAKGVVFYVDNTGVHGWAVHLRNQSSSIRWAAEGNNVDISALDNYSESREAITDFDGYMNTLKIRDAGNSSEYPAAWAVDFANGWYLPAAGQLRLLYAMISTVNTSLLEVGGNQIVWNRYWSSTEYANSSPWNVLQAGGVGHHNGYLSDVRSVCNF